MFNQNLVSKIIFAIVLFFLVQLAVLWYNVDSLDNRKLTIEAEIESLERKRDALRTKNWDIEREVRRLELRFEQLEGSVRDMLPLASKRKDLPVIYFITPTYLRPTQKADLTRLSQTLAHVPNLHWIVVEDSGDKSKTVADIIKRSGLPYAHLNVPTPSEVKMNETDPNWKHPRGVLQRNKALKWLRTNFATASQGVVYFGDDDNVYDWRLFEEMRTINKVGIWPVGIVGGLLVEAPVIEDGKVVSFNALWKPDRAFPIDMAAFAINITSVVKSSAAFTYKVPRGYQESHFLSSLSLHKSDLEPMADGCKSVFVWHTRTEKAKLVSSERQKFYKGKLSALEIEAVG